MEYENTMHKDLMVWAARTGVVLSDIDADLYYIMYHFGVGKRQVLQFIAERLLSEANVGPVVSHTLGQVVGDMVHDVVYGKEHAGLIGIAQVQTLLAGHKLSDHWHALCMEEATRACVLAKDMLNTQGKENVKRMRSNSVTRVNVYGLQ